MKAYDLSFRYEYERAADGWIGSQGPAIGHEPWPRGPLTGLPMFHALTMRLPVEYRRRGPNFPGIAFFQGEGQFARPFISTGADDPFAADVALSHPHPQLILRTDLIGGLFALLWLTEEELAGGPTAPPRDSRWPGEHPADDEGPNAWDEIQPTAPFWLIARDDPNAGIAPIEYPDEKDDYKDPWDPDTYERLPWARNLGFHHLGGTAFPVQALPDNLTPYYLEIIELPGLNFGGDGSAQIDLESDTFDWACG